MSFAHPRMLLMSARGRDSFSAAQLRALDAQPNLAIHAVPRRLSDGALVELCASAEIIGLTRRATLDFNAGVIDALPNLRALAAYATGHDWIDTQALERRGIRLVLLPDYSTQTVAEHTLGLILNMSRRLHLSERVARGDLDQGVSLRGFELHGKTVGIIGLGRIGQAVAHLTRAFGMRVIYSDPSPQALLDGAQALDLADLLAACDVAVLACSCQRGAPPLIGMAALAAMKPSALLVNPARSALVDKGAVMRAIIEKRLGGYAVDDTVFDATELAQVEHGRILQSAHTAWYSDEAMARGTQAWVDALMRLAQTGGEAPARMAAAIGA